MMLISVENKHSDKINQGNLSPACSSGYRQAHKVFAYLFYNSSSTHAVSMLNPGHDFFNRSLGVE